MAAKAPVKLTFVTGNPGKLREVQALLKTGQREIELVAEDIDLPEVQGSPEEVSRNKVLTAFEQMRGKGAFILEDTSLCFNALNGLPGPYIKWFLASIKPAGLKKMLSGFEDQSAYAQCVFAYCGGTREDIILFDGRCPGKIVEPRGNNDFGWDPCFQPDGFSETFAEMDPATKNSISHRFKALQKLQSFLEQQP